MNTETAECKVYIRPVRDVIELLGGKWKLPILVSLSIGDNRFNQLEQLIEGITPKMLSKELKDLTENGLVSRKELPGNPVSVEYALTDYGRSLDHVIDVMRKWGTEHRRKIMD